MEPSARFVSRFMTRTTKYRRAVVTTHPQSRCQVPGVGCQGKAGSRYQVSGARVEQVSGIGFRGLANFAVHS
ncbi:hypothetical protein SBA2_30039 [Acidobacteriia bacterium SbA2]|nr:hypothetical protein SBA2_30039 [Acidobacteriia bacterium SbA2]